MEYKKGYLEKAISIFYEASTKENLAQILAVISRRMKELGQLLNVDYNWGELEIYSKTQYMVAEECMPYAAASKGIDIEPDDIDVSDTVTFVWKINS